MKILLSPSKTQNFNVETDQNVSTPLYIDDAIKLNQRLSKFSPKKLGEIFNIKGELLENTHHNIINFEDNDTKPALITYTGLVFKNINLSVYGQEEYDYLSDHLRILSAYYGVLKPLDGIKPYRLDMKTSFGKTSLYKHWKKKIKDYFSDDNLIIDLASTEFSKMVDLPKVTIGFRDYKEGKYKNLATYAKMARGMLLQEMVMQKITTLDQLKELTFNAYIFNEDLSNNQQLIYSRTV